MRRASRGLPTPSLELLLTAYLLLIAFMLGMGWPWPQDPDIWWHLKTGEWIVAHGSVPWQDPFGADTRGTYWTAPSWLAEVLFHGVHRADPHLGLRLLQGVVVAATTGILLVHAWLASRSFRIALLLSMWGLVPMFPWVARPQIFSFLFVALTMFLLWWGLHRSHRAWWLLPPLMLLWANLHAYFIVGLGLMSLVLGLPWLRWLIRRRPPDSRPAVAGLVVLGLAALAPLCNPYGYHLYGEIAFMAGHASASWAAEWIKELQSPNFHDWPMRVFFAFAGLSLLAMLFSRKRPDGLSVFLFLGLFYQALQHRRDVPYFLIVMLPIVAEYLAHLPGQAWARFLRVGRGSPRQPRLEGARSGLHWALLALALAGFLIAPNRLAPVWPKPEGVPDFAGAVRYLLQNRPPAPIYHSLNNGGYFIYALWPSYAVYIDGRTGLYGEEDWQAHNDVRHGRRGWHESLLKSGACTVVWERNEPLVSLLERHPDWRRVYADEKAEVFVAKHCSERRFSAGHLE